MPALRPNVKHCRKLSLVVFQTRLSGMRVHGRFLAIGAGGLITVVVAASPNDKLIWLRLVDGVSEAESEQEIAPELFVIEQLRPYWWFMNDRDTAAALVGDSSGDCKQTDYWRESGRRRIVTCLSFLTNANAWAMDDGRSRLKRMPSVQCKISALVRTCPSLQTVMIKQVHQ